MGNPTGFIEIARVTPERRPVAERLHDWHEVYLPFPDAEGQRVQRAAGLLSPKADGVDFFECKNL